MIFSVTSLGLLTPVSVDADLCAHCSSRLRGAPWCSLCGRPRAAPAAPHVRRLDQRLPVPAEPAPASRAVPSRAVLVLRLVLTVAVLGWPVWHLLVNLASIEGCIFCQIREFVLFCAVGIALCAIWGRGVQLHRAPPPARPVWLP